MIDAGLQPTNIVELGELIAVHAEDNSWSADSATVEGVQKTGDVTIFKSVGVGVQDVAIAHAVVQKAREIGLGAVVEDYY